MTCMIHLNKIPFMTITNPKQELNMHLKLPHKLGECSYQLQSNHIHSVCVLRVKELNIQKHSRKPLPITPVTAK